jgi:hypothetical protein
LPLAGKVTFLPTKYLNAIMAFTHDKKLKYLDLDSQEWKEMANHEIDITNTDSWGQQIIVYKQFYYEILEK